MPESPALLHVTGIEKAYATPVLTGVNFALRRGEVHALIGENGAGKSTLARILAGLTQPDAGTMQVNGRPHAPRSRHEAEQQGVRMVMQELNLVGTLTVAENIFLEEMPNRFGWIDYGRMNSRTAELLQTVGLSHVDPGEPVGRLGIGQQQLVEIAAGISRRCEVLILDEPTAALTDPEVERLFAQINRLKAQGAGIIYISHRLEELRLIADRITVLRDGRMVGTHQTGAVSLDELVRLMVGRELGEVIQPAESKPGPVALRVQGLCRGNKVREVSFEARQGEILGFAGLMGAGRTETMRLIFGADQADAGEIFLHGSDTPARIRSPQDAVRQGIALLTEDRKEQGAFLPLPIRANLSITALDLVSRLRCWIEPSREHGAAVEWSEKLRVRCHSVEQRIVELSGGNQQKVIIGKWLFRNCDILIFDEPTRGIDVGARFEIYQLLIELARNGKAVIVVSSDLKELLALCDRLLVMSAGKIAAGFTRGEWTQDKIMAAALSGHLDKQRL
ncbi:MAG: sugar ABC transporter ATP-binding protein [Verrucomicrobiota bacterium]